MKIKFHHAGLVALIAFGACQDKKDVAAQPHYFDFKGMDSSVKPGDNFFLFANGTWIKNTPIPATESGTGTFLDLRNKTNDALMQLLDSVSKTGAPAGSIDQKVGDFYASGMDSTYIDQLGYTPVKPELAKINDIKDAKGVIDYVVEKQKQGLPMLFYQGIVTDDKNSSRTIAAYYQAGIGLPDRDYYFKEDPATKAVQKSYQEYIQKLFRLTGDDSVTAFKKMTAIYGLEKQFAASHKTNIELRDPQSNYHLLAVSSLDRQMPAFGWKKSLTELGVKLDSVNIAQPKYYATLNQLLTKVPLEVWKDYLRFHMLDNAASLLSSDFVNAQFDYEGKALRGQQKIKTRAQRMAKETDNNLGEALGQLYVKRYFTQDAKNRMQELVNNLQKAFETRINSLDWMSDSTKQKAKEKLHSFLKKIGYPDKWRDYSKVSIDRKKFYENVLSCSKNEYEYQLSKLGKPVDRTEWGMTPPTINAYYNPSFNEIVFPAGILQFPFFDANADDAINYGGIGMVIGHEMTHGFDDQGSQYDKDGNLKNWWSKEDSLKFHTKTEQVSKLYDGFVVLDSLHVKGALTNGENIADMGGVAIAYDAFKLTAQGKDTTKIDGFTPDQRFFLSLAQIWRGKMKDEALRQQVNTNPHSPAMYRVNGPLENFAPFYTAFGVKEGDKMYKGTAEQIHIW